MSDTDCWSCGDPEVVYTDVLGLSHCGPCWDEPEDPAVTEMFKGIRHALWQERGQRHNGEVECPHPGPADETGLSLHELEVSLGFACSGCKAVV